MAQTVGKPETARDTAQEIARRVLRHENAVLLVVLAALVGVMSVVTKGVTTSATNMMNIVLQSSMRGVAGIGEAFVILTAGIDLSIGGIGLVSSVLGTAMLTSMMGQNIIGSVVPIPLAILCMMAMAAGWGAFNGSLVSRVGIPPLIVTLGAWEITKAVAYVLNRGEQIAHLPEPYNYFGQGTVAGVPVPVITFIAVAVVAYLVLHHTRFGRSVYATGGNPASAWLSGINVKKLLLSVYIIAGFLSGLAGVIATSRVMSSSYQTLAGLELDAIAAVAIGGVSLAGGRGTIIGVVIGVLIIGVVDNAMSVLGADPAVWGIVKGTIIFIAVMIDGLRRR